MMKRLFFSPYAFASGLVVYYQKVVVAPVELHSKKGSKYDRFLRRSLDRILGEEYRPTIWCFESRFQTVFASIVRHFIPDIPYRREILQFSDGGEACLDWLDDPKTKAKEDNLVTDEDYEGPIILFLPGLTGHSQSEYIKSFINVAHTVDTSLRINVRF